MRRLKGYGFGLAMLMVLTGHFGGDAWARLPAPPAIDARGAVLMEAATGQVLYAKNAFTDLPPASTTKILTALLSFENSRLERVVMVSPRAAKVGEASVHLETGERISVNDLLKGALIKSGNDAALCLAESVGGSQELFAQLMNRKAWALGAGHSRFVNPHGLPAKGHRTSAYDLAVIARAAMNHPELAAIAATRETQIPWGTYGWNRYLKNTNKLLWSYAGADGVKTGTTREAGSCLVASASREGRRLIAVVLNSPSRYAETGSLLEYGFTNYHLVTIPAGRVVGDVMVSGGKEATVPLVAGESLEVSLPRTAKIEQRTATPVMVQAPVKAGNKMGALVILADGEEATRVDLVAAGDVAVSTFADRLKGFFK